MSLVAAPLKDEIIFQSFFIINSCSSVIWTKMCYQYIIGSIMGARLWAKNRILKLL